MSEDHRLEPRIAVEAATIAASAAASVDSADSRPAVDPFMSTMMESISIYSGVGGITTQRVFTHDSSAVYLRMKNTPIEHVFNGFGEMEFIGLLGTRVTGEVRTVYSAFLEDWNHRNENNPNREAAVDAEVRRQQWRDWWRDNTMFRTQGVNSGFTVAPPQPGVPEPRDLERLFGALEAKFRSSALDNLHLIQIFVPKERETPKHMFSRFNQIAKPL